MGSYLKVNTFEINSKYKSRILIELMRELLPNKRSIQPDSDNDERVFAVTQEELAITINSLFNLIEDRICLNNYIKNHPDDFRTEEEYEYIIEDLKMLRNILTKTLVWMVMDDESNTVFEWI